MQVQRQRLHDSALFWVAIAGVLGVIGAALFGLGATEYSGVHGARLWSNGWVRLGGIGVGVGALLLVWALVLFVAHHHAEEHWCPDPSAHRLPQAPSQPAIPGIGSGSSQAPWMPPEELGRYLRNLNETMEAHGFPNPNLPAVESSPAPTSGPASSGFEQSRSLRSVFRQLRSDLRGGSEKIETTIRTQRYWGATAGPLPDRAWKRHRTELAGMQGIGALLDALDDAFGHVKCINAFHFVRALSGHSIKPTDDLEGALTSMRRAEDLLGDVLNALGD